MNVKKHSKRLCVLRNLYWKRYEWREAETAPGFATAGTKKDGYWKGAGKLGAAFGVNTGSSWRVSWERVVEEVGAGEGLGVVEVNHPGRQGYKNCGINFSARIMDVTFMSHIIEKKRRASVVTIPQEEYEAMVDSRLRYAYLRQIIEEDIFGPPPTRKSKEVVDAFRKTKRYSGAFLESLAKGLKRSSHFTA